ncbi:acyl-CoA synthetase [Jannaschia rubra]|uniref:Long-chain-fatty-acid--CoA ligase FadD13 n=1 Tax=Jannaschia rubra TaxID=282197 RepID=A0A0M6XUA0_9RHOB|nr:acyl-CoA synthetase [Jannaschia rubra]CTQ34719.1 Long-chain-fatty-acid--CoA ligase FadD13 [Jannaschia rubra]SFG69459.1 Acyl-CoA synthetase (AMP-forming)/AMP-acid ligase II [Jannaschia rubra]
MNRGAGTPDPKGGIAPQTVRVANLAHFLTRNARRLGGAPAIIRGDRVWTWGQMDARVSALAAGLREMGVGKGDRILIQARNSHQMFESMIAAFRLGAVWVPANFRQSPEEVAWLARSSGASLMICDAEFAGHAAACDSVARHLTIGGGADGFDALVDRHMGTHVPPADVGRDDPCWFFFTSGTTGRPKAAVLTHGQLTFVLLNHLHDLMPGMTPADRSLCVAPLSHGAGIHQLVQLAAGVPTILLPDAAFDPDVVWRLVAEHRVTNMFTVPTIVKMLVEHPSVDRHDHSSLRHVIYAGAPMYRADQRRALDKLGPVLVQYFGLGEVTGNITVLPPSEHDVDDDRMRVGSCGYERTGMHVQIQDGTGAEVPAGTTGEICVAGPAVFAGYHDNPEANAKAFRDGWFRTGDLGHMDGEGFVYITGRESDMFISGGSNVYPREIEEKLLDYPGVAEAAVLGVPDAKWGEVGLAVCVAEPGQAPDAEAIRAFLKGRMSGYKVPARILFLDAMPKSGYGKITKKIIRETLRERGLLSSETA